MLFFKKTNIVILLLIVSLTFSSCMKKTAPPPPVQNKVEIPEERKDLVHKVSFQGETLALIANWYTGKSTNWKLIKEANPKLIPEKMNIGQSILIPGNLVIQREPLNKKFMQSFGKKGNTATQPAVVSPVTDSQIPAEIIKDSNPPADVIVAPTEEKQQQPNSEVITAPSVPVGTPAEVVEKNVQVPETVPPAKDTAEVLKDVPAKPKATDEEREKLLDELLSQ
ncbi:MAG: LysM peptidoglycan-binding domain-containing protein [Proteobacteria bacterium]|nr:LysM peptidoglycan-binding domain-containing protein [Pseudomonadota bacterium]